MWTIHVTKHTFHIQCTGFWGLFLSLLNKCFAFTLKKTPEYSKSQLLPSCNDNCRMLVMNVFQPNHCHFIGLLFLFMQRLVNVLSRREREMLCMRVFLYNLCCKMSLCFPFSDSFHVDSNLFFPFFFWLLHKTIWGTHATCLGVWLMLLTYLRVLVGIIHYSCWRNCLVPYFLNVQNL